MLWNLRRIDNLCVQETLEKATARMIAEQNVRKEKVAYKVVIDDELPRKQELACWVAVDKQTRKIRNIGYYQYPHRYVP